MASSVWLSLCVISNAVLRCPVIASRPCKRPSKRWRYCWKRASRLIFNPSPMTPDCLAELDRRMPFWCARSEQALARYLPAPVVHPARLHEAMRYSVLGGGKRVRPVLTYAAGLVLGVLVSVLVVSVVAVV